MSSPESVTTWIEHLKAGNSGAAQQIWERYFSRLVGLARKRLQGLPRRAEDEEDVALSAIASFCRGAERGRFPRLDDRDDLWRLLVTLTARKAVDLIERHNCRKRGGGKVAGESALDALSGSEDGDPALARVVGTEPTPAFAAQVAEDLRRRLARLPGEELRQVALWKMEGYTNQEIADRLGCAEPTVERRLRVIRKVWKADESGGTPSGEIEGGESADSG
jgi:DNA-directed RNA polymerase specialized sigma24 family protein